MWSRWTRRRYERGGGGGGGGGSQVDVLWVVGGKDEQRKVFHRDIPAIQRKRAFRTDLRKIKNLKVENHFDNGQTAQKFSRMYWCHFAVPYRIGFYFFTFRAFAVA